MKTNLFSKIVLGMLSALFAFSIPTCGPNRPDPAEPPEEQEYVYEYKIKQELNYTESIAKIDNPDQGFYAPLVIAVTENGVSYASDAVNDPAHLRHLRFDISAFSGVVNGKGDIPLTEAALKGIDEVIARFAEKNKSLVVRFCYDPLYGGAADKEPSLETMVGHVGQFTKVLNKYPDAIAVVEHGMVGPWGEMHTSAAATKEYVSPLIEAFLNNLETLPVTVRTPRRIYDYLGIEDDEIADYVIEKTDKAYRLGMFNDGYLGSATDLGTYENRARDVQFMSRINERLPYGGEVTVPGQPYHDIDKCLPEMFQMGLSYLNTQWNDQVVDKWRQTHYTRDCGNDELYYGQTAFRYIENHFGYRFVLRSSEFEFSTDYKKLRLSVKLDNVGFGNLTKNKSVHLLFESASGVLVKEKTLDELPFGPLQNGGVLSYELDIDDVPDGSYNVYMRVGGADNTKYTVRFANNGDGYSSALNANLIGVLPVNRD